VRQHGGLKIKPCKYTMSACGEREDFGNELPEEGHGPRRCEADLQRRLVEDILEQMECVEVGDEQVVCEIVERVKDVSGIADVTKCILRIKNGGSKEKKRAGRKLLSLCREHASSVINIVSVSVGIARVRGEKDLLGIMGRVASAYPEEMGGLLGVVLEVISGILEKRDMDTTEICACVLAQIGGSISFSKVVKSLEPDIKKCSEERRRVLAKMLSIILLIKGEDLSRSFLVSLFESRSASSRALGFRALYELAKRTAKSRLPSLGFCIPYLEQVLKTRGRKGEGRGGCSDDSTERRSLLAVLQVVEKLPASWPILAPVLFETMRQERRMCPKITRVVSKIVFSLPAKDAYKKAVVRAIDRTAGRVNAGGAEDILLAVLNLLYRDKSLRRCEDGELEGGPEAEQALEEIFLLVCRHLDHLLSLGLSGGGCAALQRALVFIGERRDVANLVAERLDSHKDLFFPMLHRIRVGAHRGALRSILAVVERSAREYDLVLLKHLDKIVEMAMEADKAGTELFVERMVSREIRNVSSKERRNGALAVLSVLSKHVPRIDHLEQIIFEELEVLPEPRVVRIAKNLYWRRRGKGKWKELAYAVIPLLRKCREDALPELLALVEETDPPGRKMGREIVVELLRYTGASKAVRDRISRIIGKYSICAPVEIISAVIEALNRNGCKRDVVSSSLVEIGLACGILVVVPYLAVEYAEESPKKLVVLRVIAETIGREQRPLSREKLDAVLPIVEHAARNKDPVLRKWALLIAAALFASMRRGGCEEFPHAVHMLNLAYLSILEPGLEQVVSDVFRQAVGLLGMSLVAKYLVAGMAHPARSVRDRYIKIYLEALREFPEEATHPSQDLPIQIVRKHNALLRGSARGDVH
jgi:hypothetical protein